jgi:hypothetical protein
MPILILRYIAIGLTGWATGQVLNDTFEVAKSNTHNYPEAMGISPFFLIAAAILLVAAAYAVRSIIISVKSCKTQQPMDRNYYE